MLEGTLNFVYTSCKCIHKIMTDIWHIFTLNTQGVGERSFASIYMAGNQVANVVFDNR